MDAISNQKGEIMSKHKGQGISINGSGGTSRLNEWKMKLAHAADDIPVREFKPWTPPENPRQREMDEYRAIPSLVH